MKNRSLIIATKNIEKKRCNNFFCLKNRPHWNNEGEVHLNLWNLKNIDGKEKHLYYLDIGIKLINYDNAVDSIFVFFPYRVKKSDIQDLGYLLQSKEMVDTIFNDYFELQTADEKSRLRFFKSRNTDIAVYKVPRYNIKFPEKDQKDGSLIQVKLDCKLPNNPISRNLYVRLRIKISGKENIKRLKTEEDLANDFIQAVFSKSELYDIRVNDFRNVSGDVYERIVFNFLCAPLRLKKAHLFYMTNIKDKVYGGETTSMDVRMLEYDKWKDYISEINEKHTMLAYHWRSPKEDKIRNSFEIFFRVICENKNWSKIFYCCLFVIFLNIWGTMLTQITISESCKWLILIIVTIVIISFVLWKSKLTK